MEILQGPVSCSTVSAKQAGVPLIPVNGPFAKSMFPTSNFWGSRFRAHFRGLFFQSRSTTGKAIRCSFNSSSNDNGSMAESFNENDDNYVVATVIEAVEVKSGSDGFIIKMRDGVGLRCIHNNPQGGYVPHYPPHPAIVLRIEDGSDILLPIIVSEMPSVFLMAAIRNVPMARPSLYEIVEEMIDKMGYGAQLVRVTKRVNEAYYAELHLAKIEGANERISFDLRPSDAINIAIRCKVPIQVNKYLAYGDGVRVLEPTKMTMQSPVSDGLLFTELDRPNNQSCFEAEEFILVKNMLIAAVEERYVDAARWRDALTQLRSKRKNWA